MGVFKAKVGRSWRLTGNEDRRRERATMSRVGPKKPREKL